MSKVSIIVTTFNRKDLLKETIDSILAQSFKDFELIVIDNFSNYDFLLFIKNLNDKRVKGLQNHNNGIIAINRNIGIKFAVGDYIAFCDDDDSWEETKLEKQINFISKKKIEDSKFVLYTNYTEVGQNNNKKRTLKKEINHIDDLIYSNQLAFSTTMISNHLLKEKFNEHVFFLAVEDYVFWMKLKIKNYNFFLIKENLVNIRVEQSSMSLKKYALNHIRTILALVYTYLNNKNSKISSLNLGMSLLRQVLKFLIKRVVIIKFKKID